MWEEDDLQNSKHMTTLRKIIERLNHSGKGEDVDYESLLESFGIHSWMVEFPPHESDARLKMFFIKKWQCTDTWVGWQAVFFDERFVGLVQQDCRKCSVKYSWTTKEAASYVKAYLLTLTDKQEPNFDLFDEDVMDSEIPDTYKLEYASEVIHDYALYNGERVQIVYGKGWLPDRHERLVKLGDKEFPVRVADLDFEYETG
jgi:hypothetical protein